MAHFAYGSEEYWQLPDRFRNVPRRATARVAWHVLGDVEDDAAPAVLILDLDPGCVISRHAHACPRFEVVVRGALLVDDRTLRPGDVMVAAPGEAYGPHIAGPEGCTTVEVFGALRGLTQPIYELVDGTQVTVDVLSGGSTPPDIAGMEHVAGRVAEVLARAQVP